MPTPNVPDANAPSNSVYGKKKPTLKNAKILKEQLVGQRAGQIEPVNVATTATVEETQCDPQGFVSAIKSLNLEPATRKVPVCNQDNRLHRQSLHRHRLCQESTLKSFPSTADVFEIAQPLRCMDLSKQPLSTVAVRKGCKVKNMRLTSLRISDDVHSIDDGATDSTRTPVPSAASSPEQIQVTPAIAVPQRKERRVYDRAFMLGIWQSLSHKEKIVPTSVQTLCACRVEVSTRHPVLHGSKKKKGPRKDSQALVPGTGAYKPFQSGQDLEKNVLALLNKISPENFHTIVDRFAAVELKDSEELSKVIKMIFQQVLRQPFYCETYADMVKKLQDRTIPFKNGVTFKRLLINACQEEFENLSASLQFATDGLTREEVFDEKKKRKDRVLANMKFIGYLCLRKMIALRVIRGIVQELIAFEGSSDEFPQEEHVECALELVQAVGSSLDHLHQRQEGHVLITQFISRLTHLKTSEVDGRRVYTKRVQFQIQDVIELRAANWKKAH